MCELSQVETPRAWIFLAFACAFGAMWGVSCAQDDAYNAPQRALDARDVDVAEDADASEADTAPGEDVDASPDTSTSGLCEVDQDCRTVEAPQCSVYVCSEERACVLEFKREGAPCDDMQACTSRDRCTADGVCVGEDPFGACDPNCHWDCFGWQTCEDGVVTTYTRGPVPCEHWTGECPSHESYVCERGCRIDGEFGEGGHVQPHEACEEFRPKQAGDACTAFEDCLPQVAERDADGVLQNVYLECDLEAGVCVEVDPPNVPDYLAGCGVTEADLRPHGEGYVYGFAQAQACDSGLCLISETDDCITQGCTVPCEGDRDCPPGSVCADRVRDWSAESDAGYTAVCEPSRPYSLSCP